MMLQSLKKISNATNLKILAILLVFLDHIYEMFGAFVAPMWITMLGRVVFPLFMFLAADSFYYTHNRKTYLKRLLFMTWFMIIGNMIVSQFFTNGQVGLANNAFGAFFLAGISICA
ncbi:conjugal transfer protein TraX [Streptococcus sp. HMSC073A12]|uniref:conjugal transfer protein TraX n=1 Tax=Streptococcus sp. HMSC073A12 TaxID=1739380 RepID=UPI0021BFFFE3|nr:conjugal transfer protein TraX [Streptococcus sp. HMSC073A12]